MLRSCQEELGFPVRSLRPEAHKRLLRGSAMRGKRDFTSDLRGKSSGESVSKDEGTSVRKDEETQK